MTSFGQLGSFLMQFMLQIAQQKSFITTITPNTTTTSTTTSLPTAFPGYVDLVTTLPGIEHISPLPYRHYSGYLSSINDSYLHYWFFESQSSNATTDPVVLWLNGGPGCSSLLGALTELGPLRVSPSSVLNNNNNNDTIVVVENNKYSWNTIANVLFLESPPSAGFSYRNNPTTSTNTTTNRSYGIGDTQAALINYEALKSFYRKFPHYLKNDLYLTGESYAGVYLPMLAELLLLAASNKSGGDADYIDRQLKLRGVAIGNGFLDENLLTNSLIHYGYYHGLVSSATYRDLLRHCCANATMADYRKCHIVESTNDGCVNARDDLMFDLKHFLPINPYNIHGECKPKSTRTNMQLHAMLQSMNFFTKNNATNTTKNDQQQQQQKPSSSEKTRRSPPCEDFGYLEDWLNRADVREALHIDTKHRQAKTWQACSAEVLFSYKREKKSMQKPMKLMVDSGVKVLIYNGDIDTVCNFMGNQWFVEDLGYEITQLHTPWRFNGQVGGFMQKFKHNLTFTTVLGAGHTVPKDRPGSSFEMFRKFLLGKF